MINLSASEDKRNHFPSYYYFWAKTPSGGSQYHLLPYHLIDSGILASAIWDNSMPVTFKKSLSDGFGLSEDDSKNLLSFFVSIHDIGKATPVFQSIDEDYKGKLIEKGFDFNISHADRERHDQLGYKVLPYLLEEIGFEKKVSKRVALVLSGHHGIYPMLRFSTPGREIGGEKWNIARGQLVKSLYYVFNRPPVDISLFDNDLAVKISGFVTVSDWLASNERYFSYSSQVINLPEYTRVVAEKAKSVLNVLNWNLPVEQPFTFSSLFPEILGPMRPLQEAAVSLADKLTGQYLVLVEAPMGEGKTEAGLFLAASSAFRGQQGLYFALPTQATSNQMFRRVEKYLKNRYDSNIPNLILLHGHASLSSEFEVIKEDWAPSKIYDDDIVRISEWFTYTKRGLLSLFGVGTVDQILMASVRTKHVSVRLFGLANKVIIIDELHAYDTYMSTLLGRLFEWLADLGCSVIVLSATLPKEKSIELLRHFSERIIGEREVVIEPYPRLTAVTRDGVLSRTIGTSTYNDIEVRRFPPISGEETILALGRELHRDLAKGGCAAIICNSVTKAQEVYDKLKPFFGNEIDLFHARFPYGQRKEREDRNIERFKKDGKRPHRFVLVATQVVEQSLDLDFDLMVTELAPGDLVLQRGGRLWRHKRKRPEGLKNPVLYLCCPDEPEFSFSVYNKHVLLRSWLALRNLEKIRIPDDMEAIVEATYKNKECSDPAFKEIWDSTLAVYLEKLDDEKREAQNRWIPMADSKNISLKRMTENAVWDDESQNLCGSLTRLNSYPIARAVCLFETEDGVCSAIEGCKITMNHVPTSDDVRLLLFNSVGITGSGIYNAFLDNVHQPEEWQKSALLRGHFPLILDSEGNRRVGKYLLKLDPELGIIKKGVDDADI